MNSGLPEVLRAARTTGRAVGAFNCPSFDAMLGVTRAAAALDAPVIIQTSARLVARHGARMMKGWFNVARSASGAAAYLHLDHCQDLALIGQCVDAGWDMVMYDGSSLTLEANLRNTLAAMETARSGGAAIEAEVGGIGGAEDGAACSEMAADIPSVRRFVEKAAVDCLAVGFGNAHGHYTTTAGLRWDVLEEAGLLAPMPLVLHGGTGLTPEEFLRAIRYGCAKINISTALKDAYQAVMAGLAAAGVKGAEELHERLTSACEACASSYIRLFWPAAPHHAPQPVLRQSI